MDVASRLRITSSRFVDSAHTFYTVAVEKNFTAGRRSMHVVAACLYIVCRQNKSRLMLIDFSDALQVNVYTLGTCFLKFRRLLALSLEIVDPALYIYRFAAHLDLDDKVSVVAATALRLVARMKRDWIVTGRRPAGICAAALLIASRAHGISKKNQDVTNVMRVCGMTVTNRVKDFENTPTANLSLEQFMTLDFETHVETEADPPVFTSNRIKEARALAIRENNVDLLTSGKLDDPRIKTKRATKWRQSSAPTKKQKKLKEMYNDLEMQMAEDTAEKDAAKDKSGDAGNALAAVTGESIDNDALQLKEVTIPEGIKYPLGNNGKALILPNQATAEELQKSTQKEQEKIDLTLWKEDMTKESMGEIDDLFRDDEEIKLKEALFNRMNKDYIEKQERKESERIAAESLAKEKDAELVTQAADQAKYLKKTRRMRNSGKNTSEFEGIPTTEEALLIALSSRKISRKINYNAMSSIFDDGGAFSTELLVDREPEPIVEDEMFAMV